MFLGTRNTWTRRFQTNKSQWPDPQESTGQFYCKMGGNSSCWEAIGDARETFLRIAGEIKEFLEKYSDPVPYPVTWTIYMIGRTKNTSEPMIIFCSRDLNCRKQVRKSVEESGILERYTGVRVGDASRPPDFNHLVQLAGLSYESILNSDLDNLNMEERYLRSLGELLLANTLVFTKESGNSFGKQILIPLYESGKLSSIRIATAGGILKSGNRYFYLTAGHAFDAASDSALPDLSEENDFEFDIGETHDSEDEDEFMESTSKGSATPESTEMENSGSMTLSGSESTDSASHREGTLFQGFKKRKGSPPASFFNNETRHLITGGLHYPTPFITAPLELSSLSSFPTSSGHFSEFGSSPPLLRPVSHESKFKIARAQLYDNGLFVGRRLSPVDGQTQPILDYALIEIDPSFLNFDPSPMQNNLKSPYPPHYYLKAVARSSRVSKVVCITGFSGILRGTISGTPSYTTLPGSSKIQELWTVRLEGSLMTGDCGSWAVDESGHLFGHIVAGSPNSGVAHIVPAYQVLEDAKTRFGLDLELSSNSNAATRTEVPRFGFPHSAIPKVTDDGAFSKLKGFDDDNDENIPESSTTPAFHNETPMTQLAYPPNQPRAVYDNQTGPYLKVGSPPIPEVKSFNPRRGTKGTKFHVSFTTPYELPTLSLPTSSLMFGQRKVPASLMKIGQQGAVCQYSLLAEVPDIAEMGWQTFQVPISMFIEAGEGEFMIKVDVGNFTYVAISVQAASDPQENSRKRKMSSVTVDLMKSPVKRTSSQHQSKEDFSSSYGYTSTEGVPNYSRNLQPNSALPSSNAFNVIPQYNRSVTGHQSQSSRILDYGYPGFPPASPPTARAPSPQAADLVSTHPWVSTNLSRNPELPLVAVTARPVLSFLPSAAVIANPPLIRTSTLQQTPHTIATPDSGHPGGPYNAYSLYPNKANLEIIGDLDVLAVDWSPDEWKAKRRIIHFRRSQSGSTITITFNPVAIDERPPNSICISCIYWEEKRECFITSVDIMYLLQQLLAARLTVEEKNRIRRNLEGFQPITVSKVKPGSEELFKVIMAFPAPKPRNIEKDVKVFHWKDLTIALKEIIRKYSTSPSSMLPPATPPLSSISPIGHRIEGLATGSSCASDYHGAGSPPSISSSTTSIAYDSNNLVRSVSPHNKTSMAIQTSPSNLGISVSNGPNETGYWQGGSYHMQRLQKHQQLRDQSGGGSWDISTYLENNPSNAGGSPAQSQSPNLQPPHTMADTTGSSGDNRII